MIAVTLFIFFSLQIGQDRKSLPWQSESAYVKQTLWHTDVLLWLTPDTLSPVGLEKASLARREIPPLSPTGIALRARATPRAVSPPPRWKPPKSITAAKGTFQLADSLHSTG